MHRILNFLLFIYLVCIRSLQIRIRTNQRIQIHPCLKEEDFLVCLASHVLFLSTAGWFSVSSPQLELSSKSPLRFVQASTGIETRPIVWHLLSMNRHPHMIDSWFYGLHFQPWMSRTEEGECYYFTSLILFFVAYRYRGNAFHIF